LNSIENEGVSPKGLAFNDTSGPESIDIPKKRPHFKPQLDLSSVVLVMTAIGHSLAPGGQHKPLLNQTGSLVLTGVPARFIAAFLRYTGAGKHQFDSALGSTASFSVRCFHFEDYIDELV
jgi:hypothetical protein